MQAERGKKRLAFLLKQAEVFQHFAPTASDIGKKCALSSRRATEPRTSALPVLVAFHGFARQCLLTGPK